MFGGQWKVGVPCSQASVVPRESGEVGAVRERQGALYAFLSYVSHEQKGG